MHLSLNKSVKEIMLLCDHSIETSLAVPSQVLIFSALYKIKFGHFVKFGRWPLLTFTEVTFDCNGLVQNVELVLRSF